MAGPWEKFQTAQDGPWSKFAPAPNHYAATAADQSVGQNLLAGVGGSMKGMYLGGKQMLGLADQKEIDEHKAGMAGLGTTTAGTIGQFAGVAIPATAAAMIPGGQGLAGAALTGAGFGALEPTSEGESRLKNMALGGVVGGVGQKIASAAGRLNRPVQSTLTPERQILAQRAQAMGLPLNVAQQTGSRPLQIIDSVLDNMPLTADKQMATKDIARQRFNEAVGKTFGATESRLTPDAIKGARDRIGQQFTDLSERNTMKLDDQAIAKLGDLTEQLNKFDTPDVAKIAGNYIDDLLSKSSNGEISGSAYRKFDSALGRKIRSTTNGDLRHALGEIQGTVRETMDRSISQADAEAWRSARRQYANMMNVAPIAAKDVEGNVSAKLLWNKVNQRPGELRNVAEVGRAFANDIPDSGTAQRGFYQRLIENPLTAVWQQGIGGISLPLQSALNSPAGRKYFTQGLLDVSPQMANVGRASMVGAPVGLLQFGE
jgi:hypothetical protein